MKRGRRRGRERSSERRFGRNTGLDFNPSSFTCKDNYSNLSLGFPICKMGLRRPHLQGFGGIGRTQVWKEQSLLVLLVNVTSGCLAGHGL